MHQRIPCFGIALRVEVWWRGRRNSALVGALMTQRPEAPMLRNCDFAQALEPACASSRLLSSGGPKQAVSKDAAGDIKRTG